MTKYDAIVVGSGMSGGWSAKELAEKGLNRDDIEMRVLSGFFYC